MTPKCVHCGLVVEEFSGHWAHRIGEGSYLNRCQSESVPYGHEAHPGDVPCPDWCMGSREGVCIHIAVVE